LHRIATPSEHFFAYQAFLEAFRLFARPAVFALPAESPSNRPDKPDKICGGRTGESVARQDKIYPHLTHEKSRARHVTCAFFLRRFDLFGHSTPLKSNGVDFQRSELRISAAKLFFSFSAL
jgi:hypothetical protein